MGDMSDPSRLRNSIPHLSLTPSGHQLCLHGKPFFILGAELQNSSFSCPEHMQHIWPKLKYFNVNTVLANVSWETIEPEEGIFDFTRLDQAIYDARWHGLHLILLWFGAFKNAKSTYAPSWVKTNTKRFPRAMIRRTGGQKQVIDALSVFNPELVNADAAAFTRLMRHIKQMDEKHTTVIMIQVENEAGLLGDSRDVCPDADRYFQASVPAQLTSMLVKEWELLTPSLRDNLVTIGFKSEQTITSSWQETFGNHDVSNELFMAYYFASYVQQVTEAGKAEYPLPMFTNVWQNYADEDSDKSQPTVVGGGGKPGDYPSGGAVSNALDIWQHFAPSLDFIAPDIYLNDYDAVCSKYRHRGQPLFIPEQRRDEYGARRIWSAYGTHRALCASPFGIDTLEWWDTTWRKHYGLLAQVSDLILEAQQWGRATLGFFFDELAEGQTSSDPILTQINQWNLSIERSFVFGKPSLGFGTVIHLGDARFLLIGEGFQVRFTSADQGSIFTGILSFVEKISDPRTKELRDGRVLNGDETRSGEVAIMPSESPDYGDFPISVTIPAGTRIAECEVYALF